MPNLYSKSIVVIATSFTGVGGAMPKTTQVSGVKVQVSGVNGHGYLWWGAQKCKAKGKGKPKGGEGGKQPAL